MLSFKKGIQNFKKYNFLFLQIETKIKKYVFIQSKHHFHFFKNKCKKLKNLINTKALSFKQMQQLRQKEKLKNLMINIKVTVN